MDKLPKNTLIVVADGQKATMYRNEVANAISIKFDDSMSQKFSYFKGPAPMPSEIAEGEVGDATFAKHIADNLYKEVHAGNFDNLVLIADPQTLGQMRPSIHKEVQDCIVCELPKDLTNSTVEDIEKTLRAA